MSGLWPTLSGSVVRPGGVSGPGFAGDQPSLSDVFVVPQSIHMVMGTLCDQITYPHRLEPAERTEEVEDRLRGLLEKVGVVYLLARWGNENELANHRDADASAELGLKGTGHERGAATREGWDREVEWEHVLSLGEQQRLGLARMYYHSPKFAVLDECTSAVSIDAEEVLYREAAKQGVTTITISQRNTLPQVHKQSLPLLLIAWTDSDRLLVMTGSSTRSISFLAIIMRAGGRLQTSRRGQRTWWRAQFEDSLLGQASGSVSSK